MRPPARVHRGVPGARQWAAALLLAALTRVGPAPAATLVITVQSPNGHALAGAVVTARPLDAPGKRPAPVHAVMDQVQIRGEGAVHLIHGAGARRHGSGGPRLRPGSARDPRRLDG